MSSDPKVRNHLEGHVGHIEKIVRKIAKNEAVVDDLTQECCVRIIEKEELWGGNESKLSQWMNSISRNVVINAIMRRKRPVAQSQRLLETEVSAEDEVKDFDEGDVSWLMEQVMNLSERQKEIVHLHYFKGMKLNEIAVELGISPPAVSKQLTQARSVIRSKKAADGGLMSLPLIGAILSSSKVQSLWSSMTAPKVVSVSAVFLFASFVMNGAVPSVDTSSSDSLRVVKSDLPYRAAGLASDKILESLTSAAPLNFVTAALEPDEAQFKNELLKETNTVANTVASYDKNENKIFNLNINLYGNRDLLLSRLTTVFQKAYDKNIAGSLVTAQMKQSIDNDFKGSVGDYLAHKLPAKVNILDKRRNFLLVFLDIDDHNSIKALNRLQKKYFHKFTICAVVQPLVQRVKGDPVKLASTGKVIEAVDPTFFPRNQQALFKVFEEGKKFPEYEEPDFLICFDENRDLGGLKDYKAKPNYASKYSPYSNTKGVNSFAAVINRQGQMIWMGQAKNAAYYMGVVDSKEFTWSDFRKAALTMDGQNQYFSLISGPKGLPLAEGKLKSFYKDFTKSPEMMIVFVERMLKRDLFEFKDMKLALGLIRKTGLLLGVKDPVVTKMLMDYYFVNGDLALARQKAALLKKEINTKLDPVAFKKLSRAKLLFANQYWPYLTGAPNKISEEDARKVEKRLLKNFMADPHAFAEIVYFCMRSEAAPYENEHFNKLVGAAYKKTLTAIKENRIDKKNHKIFAAYSLFRFRTEEYKKSASLMVQAVKCIELTKDKDTLAHYKALHKNISRRIR
jgi:RNA polymerase sigma-70 factor (ECF subfamily)